MRVRRLWMVLGLTLGFVVAGTAIALACNEPRISLDKDQAQAGETVPFTILNVDEGATYTVTAAGVQQAAGTAPAGGAVRGTFTMPDLGDSPRPVAVEAVVEHRAGPQPGTWRTTATMRYVAPAPAAREQGPASQPVPAPAGERPAPANEPASTPQPSGSPAAARAPQTAAPQSPGTRSPGASRTGDRTSAPVRRRTSRADVAAPRRDVGSRAVGRAVTRRAATSRPGGAVRELVPSAASPAARVRRAPGDDRSPGRAAPRPSGASGADAATRHAADRSGSEPATMPIVSVADGSEHPWAVIVGAGILVGAVLVLFARRRRRRDDEGDGSLASLPLAPAPFVSSAAALECEAALQEMVAEHRARVLLDEPGADAIPVARETGMISAAPD